MIEKEPQAPKTALVLRCCAADMSSKNGFIWPGVGEVAEAPDWQDNDQCGAGLHGWLYGQGDHGSSNYSLDANAKWLVVEVDLAGVRMLGGKCKFQRGTVRFVGSRSEAAAYMIANEPQAANVAVIGAVLECGDNQQVQGGALSVLTGGNEATMTGGNYATMTGGDEATMTGGNYATMTGGYYATMTGGNYATMTGGNYATMTGGDEATMTGGNGATMTGGNGATMTGGYYATMTGGNGATMTGGDEATMTGGNEATMTGGNGATMTGGDEAKMTGGDEAKMTGGDGATMTGGDYAKMHFQYWDGSRNRTVIAYVGEDGIEANTPYRLGANHKPQKVTE